MNDYAVFTAPDTLRLERLLPGPIERVWRYLTDTELRGRWLAAGEMDLRMCGTVELIFRNCELVEGDDPPPPKYADHVDESRLQGRITVCEPPHRLAYTWGAETDASEVSFELSTHGNGVKLVLIHSRLDTGKRSDITSVAAGWHTHVGLLIDRLADRMPAGFWVTHTHLEAEYEQRIPQAAA